MASIGPVKLNIKKQSDTEFLVDVKYEILFDSYDVGSNQPYAEVCRLMGDDTGTGDPPDAGPDDTIGFLTPLFFRSTQADGSEKLERHWTKTFRKADLDEDRGPIPNPDEIKAVVTLTPVPPATVTAESDLVKKRIKI
jgi:hypothetical protein